MPAPTDSHVPEAAGRQFQEPVFNRDETPDSSLSGLALVLVALCEIGEIRFIEEALCPVTV